MYAGAAVSTVNLIILLALIGDIGAYHAVLGHHLSAAQVSKLTTVFITVAILWALVPIALWLWMARACGRGRNWARIVSTVLFGVATLDLTGFFGPPDFRVSLAETVFGPAISVLADRPRRGVVVVASVLPRVLQAAGLHAGPAPGADGRVRPGGADGRTRPVQGTAAASRVSHRPALATYSRPCQRDQLLYRYTTP
jgi:hypothetical protein